MFTLHNAGERVTAEREMVDVEREVVTGRRSLGHERRAPWHMAAAAVLRAREAAAQQPGSYVRT